jgi:drug/metabolite transporter (DMT)-like permease
MAQLGWANLGAMAYLGVVGTAVAFVWYYQGVRAIGPTRSAVFNNLVPIFGMTSGVLVLGEPLHASMVVGGLVALAGVTLVNLPSRR